MTTNITTGESISFFQQYFINPIIQKTGYNPVSTLTYGVLLIIGAYVLFKLFKKLGFEMNMDFFKNTIPFILLVSVWRVLTDAGIYPYGFLTTTPGLYIPVILLFFPIVFISAWFKKRKQKYEIIYAGVPTILLITQLIIFFNLAANNFNVEAAWKVIYFTLITSAPFIFILKWDYKTKNKLIKALKKPFNAWMFIAHMFDAAATHVSLEYYNYFEQHVVPKLVFDLSGTSLSFFAWKVIILAGVIYILDKDDSNKELVNFIKMIFITYGIATGLRGFLRLSLGV